MESLTRYVIFDTDMGLDDAWALVMLLTLGKLSHVKVLAITCSFGNTELPYVKSNTLRILESMQMNIPVHDGRSRPLLPSLLNNEGLGGYFGEDGFSDLFPFVNESALVEKSVAAEAINKLVDKYPNQISFISVGPLSNLALALTVYESIGEKFREIFIMGGNACGFGNVRQKSSSEFNFYMDPEAAHIVLSQAASPIYILPIETCLPENMNITNDWRFNGPLKDIQSSDTMDMLTKAEMKHLEKHNDPQWSPADAVLVACFLFKEEMILAEKTYNAYVEVYGIYTRGQVVIDRMDTDITGNIHFIMKINEAMFKQYILDTASALVDI